MPPCQAIHLASSLTSMSMIVEDDDDDVDDEPDTVLPSSPCVDQQDLVGSVPPLTPLADMDANQGSPPGKVSHNKGRPLRRVRFAQPVDWIVARVPCATDMTVTERHDLWWNENDFNSFRQVAKVTACQARLTAGCQLLDRCAYTKAKHYADSIHNQEDMFQFLQTVRTELADWSTGSARGLEHWTSRTHYEARRYCLAHAQRAVLSAKNKDTIPETYRKCSETSKILARLLGEADALAAIAESPFAAACCFNKLKLKRTLSPERRCHNLKRPVQHRGIA